MNQIRSRLFPSAHALLNRSTFARWARAIVPMVWLAPALAIAPSAHATVASDSSGERGAEILEGMWCGQDSQQGETIVGYSAAGLEVTALTVLSEEDPRRIGRQSSMQLTIQSPNVFVSRDSAGADQVFSVDERGLTVASVVVENRGTRQELRQAVASQSYHRCDVRQAWQRAQAFMSSPKAEAATRKALQLEAQRKAEVEQWQQEQAEMEQRRNASREAFYTDLIRQLNRAPGSIGSARQRS